MTLSALVRVGLGRNGFIELTIVQQTSLREITTSTWAMQRSADPAVQEAARTIITQHKDLENRDTGISTRMGPRHAGSASTACAESSGTRSTGTT